MDVYGHVCVLCALCVLCMCTICVNQCVIITIMVTITNLVIFAINIQFIITLHNVTSYNIQTLLTHPITSHPLITLYSHYNITPYNNNNNNNDRHGATGRGNALRNWELRAREVRNIIDNYSFVEYLPSSYLYLTKLLILLFLNLLFVLTLFSFLPAF